MVKPKKIDKFCLNQIGKNSSDRYILQVDLEYPDELNNDYPFFSSRKT